MAEHAPDFLRRSTHNPQKVRAGVTLAVQRQAVPLAKQTVEYPRHVPHTLANPPITLHRSSISSDSKARQHLTEHPGIIGMHRYISAGSGVLTATERGLEHQLPIAENIHAIPQRLRPFLKQLTRP
ncbi:hypothetical protein D3C86_1832900 [compost metagenome]